ncbi:hypothetical protein DL764_000589 [Monosporascus ibericus]|uniref:Uncharacterized protein n=1 Tax=Monosporascus ibericus TaxID=155417 RepID=A0A4Q4TSV0_9PEZI|nr:hypothetical protein DL764_000589 [Monosporascus ibericus]
MSFLEDPCRRGYEVPGMSLREGDPLPDAKKPGRNQSYRPPASSAPTSGPTSPKSTSMAQSGRTTKGPISSARQSGRFFSKASAAPGDLVASFAKRPIVSMEMIRYPHVNTNLRDATNPLNLDDPNKDTVGQLLMKRFRNQYSATKEAIARVGLA